MEQDNSKVAWGKALKPWSLTVEYQEKYLQVL